MASTEQVGRTGMQVGSPGQELMGTAMRGKQRRHEAGMQSQQLQTQVQLSREQQAFQKERYAEALKEQEKDRQFQMMLSERNQQFQQMMQDRVYKRADEVFVRDKALIQEENERRKEEDQNRRAYEDSVTMMGLKMMLELQRQSQGDPVKKVKLEQRKQEIVDMYDQQRSVVEGLISSAQSAVQNSPIGKGEFGLENWSTREAGPAGVAGEVIGMQDTKTGKMVLHPDQESTQYVWNQIDGISKRMSGGKVSLDQLLQMGPEKIQQGLVNGTITTADLQTAKAVSDQVMLALQTQTPQYGRDDLDSAAGQAVTLAQGRLRKFNDMVELVRMDTKNPQAAKLVQDALNVYEGRGMAAQLKELHEAFGEGPGGVDAATGALGTALQKYMQENMPEFVGPEAEYLKNNYNQMVEQMAGVLGGVSKQSTGEVPQTMPSGTPSMLTPRQISEAQGTNPMYNFKDMGGRVAEALKGQEQFQFQQQDEQRRVIEAERLKKAAGRLNTVSR